MWSVEVLETADNGKPTGKYRLTATSDDGGGGPHGLMEHAHNSREEAESCSECRRYVGQITGMALPPVKREIDPSLAQAQVKHMVDRFLAWRLPEGFSPDGGITFAPTFRGLNGQQLRRDPTGTNLFTAQQAEAMVRHMLDGLPESSPVTGTEAESFDDWKRKWAAVEDNYLDKIGGLEADLDEAVEVAYTRGAVEWARLNYPKQFERLVERHGLLPNSGRVLGIEAAPAAELHSDFAEVGYEPLASVLQRALDQAQRGKGKERHANGRAFLDQPIMEIGRMVGVGYQTGQAMKKTQEAVGMLRRDEADRAVAELLGAINYLAAAVMLIEEGEA